MIFQMINNFKLYKIWLRMKDLKWMNQQRITIIIKIMIASSTLKKIVNNINPLIVNKLNKLNNKKKNTKKIKKQIKINKKNHNNLIIKKMMKWWKVRELIKSKMLNID